MLIHGRLLVTHNGLMLDEVRSLLQKSLRRQELDLAYRATKELLAYEKDQLPWKSIVTFIFEDHCLTDVKTLKALYNNFQLNDKYKAVEILGKCYTCRHAACLQVVALTKLDKLNATVWDKAIPLEPDLVGLVVKESNVIDCDVMIALLVKFWKEENIEALIEIFALVNMAAKVENRKLTTKGVAYLLSRSVKKPTLYHLVLSVLHKASKDEYMKQYTLLCYNFAAIEDTPQGLILFCILSVTMFKNKVLTCAIPDISKIGQIDWKSVPKLDHMPEWAVDKHTYRGKFGRESLHLFKKKFENIKLSDAELVEFHGLRPKVDIRVFFDVGCICNNDILNENPIWDEAKQMYLKQKPSLQKCAKMTKACYEELKKAKAIMFKKTKIIDESDMPSEKRLKRSLTEPSTSGEPKYKQMKLTKYCLESTNENAEKASTVEEKVSVVTSKDETRKDVEPSSDGCKEVKSVAPPNGALLQLPTGSAKVYTRLDTQTMKVWKGPYKTVPKQNLCIFLHRAMREVFQDLHTMELETKGAFIIFPLLKSKAAEIATIHKAFYDCIGKKEIAEEDGVFITRESLGLIQLHKISEVKLRDLPVTIWLHFVYRYLLNVGDSGLYNAIATEDLSWIFGIDMKENRAAVKGNDVMNMMFTKLPKQSFLPVIKKALKVKKADIQTILEKDFDFDKLKSLYKEYKIDDGTERCQRRLLRFRKAIKDL